jgi:hypothetical protein
VARVAPFLIGLLAAFALEPVFRAGLTADDYRWLLSGAGGPLLHGWAALEVRLQGVPEPGVAPFGARLEALGLVALMALGVHAFLRRSTAPWLGAGQAALAGATAAGLVILHPLVPGVVAGLGGRSELLGLTILAWGTALYLRGRQERDERSSVLAFALLAATGFAARMPVLGVVLIAGSEYVSARRHRARVRRLRTSATAAVGAGLALSLASFLGMAPIAATGEVRGTALALVDGLGWLLLPPGGGSLGSAGSWLAAGMTFLAVQPVFRAARHAPRLWGALFGGWALLLGAALWAPVNLGATPRLDRPGPWIGALVVLVAGMGLAASAMRGGRGTVLRLGLFLAAAVLARGNGLAFLEAGRRAARLSEEMGADVGRRMLVLEPDPPAFGVDAAGESLAWLRHPALLRRSETAPFDPGRTRSTSRAGFLAFTRSEVFAAWRLEGLDVLLPRDVSGERRRLSVPEPWSGSGARSWRTSLTQRFEPELDPLVIDGLRIRAEVGQDPREIGSLAWEARTSEASGALEGVVSSRSGEQQARFDLSSSLAWRLAGPVRSLVLERAVEPILQGELLERLPAPAGAVSPVTDGDDWSFTPWPPTEGVDGEPTLVLLDLADLACLEVPVSLREGRWLARGAERFASRTRAGGGTLRWALEYRALGRALLRAEGQLP